MARSEQDAGAVPSNKALQGLTLVLSRTDEQESQLQALLAAQQDPTSSQYHSWLTPDEFAARFGVADADIEKIEAWLQQQGFTVSGVSRSKNRITFSGTVGQVESAFNTQMHYYRTDSTLSFAPSADISIPTALSAVVLDVSNLTSFRLKPRIKPRTTQKASTVTPNFTSSQSGSHFLTPKDVATIYDVNAVYNAGYTGTGQAIAVVGQSAIQVSDIEHFQTAAGLTVKDPTLVLMPNSGTATYYTGGDEAESDLDLEYTSAMAPGATIYFVFTGNNQNYDVFDAMAYAIDTRIAPIISVSYGACEVAMGSEYATYDSALAQAAAQGQTVVAAAGDDGSMDCYEQTGLSATQQQALAVDFPASSQYVTGMGGTEFSSADIASTNTTYWTSASGSDLISSAKSYIPEQVWNDSSSSGLSAGGGGVSIYTSRPSWQTGVTGISSGTYRMVPDIALASSPENPGYLLCSSDSDATGVSGSCANGFRDSNNNYLTVLGGTSFASPIFSGMVALINQKLNSTGQGVINSTLYQLASNSTTYASAFHDVTSGNNACPTSLSYCTGSAASQYSATTGYDQATGLGSIDLFSLISAWPAPSSNPLLTTSATSLSAATTTPTSGASDVITIQVASGSSSVTTVPTGTLSIAVDGTTVSSSLALTNGAASYTFSSTTNGTHVVTATYSGDTNFASSTGVLPLTIGSTTATSGGTGSSGTTTITVTPTGGFTGTVTLGLSTANPALQQYACYDLDNASVTGTTAVTQTLTIYLGTTYCENAQINGRALHRFASSTQRLSASTKDNPPGSQKMDWQLAGVLMVGLWGFRRRRFRLVCVLVVGLASSLALTGCGGGSSTSTNSSSSSAKSFSVSASPTSVTIAAGTSGMPTGTYTATLTGSTTSLSSSTTLTLVVN